MSDADEIRMERIGGRHAWADVDGQTDADMEENRVLYFLFSLLLNHFCIMYVA